MLAIDHEKYIYVQNSVIHGNGLFTSVDIQAGTLVMKISGEMISGNECERREEAESNVYIFWKDDNSYIDTSQSEKIKYINHNCNFNCDVAEIDNELVLIAAQNICAGEELTIDYGYEEIYAGCSCIDCFNKNESYSG